ncbi:MAG: undecaprenyl-diphosphate phosphatase [Deltaproteobacteria bacterium]|nr:undecaprenyl-diphosphate phosphatase [Deltaproteobacteria bacterium]
MDWIQSVVLGLVEGVTEYLPVSSTGHLILAQRAMGIPQSDAADAYAICIQAGAILAVLLLYRRRVAQAFRGVLGRDPAGRALAVNLVAAFLPAAVVGLLAEHRIKDLLFNLPSIAAAWVVGGLVILALDRAGRAGRGHVAGGGVPGRALEDLGWRGALLIGAFQVIAMWPGTSRSLVTILGGLAVGLSLPAAVEFSFLLGVITLTAATAKDAWSDGRLMLDAYGAASIAAGFAAAALSAVVAVRWMVAWLSRHGLAVFGWYRVAAGAALFALIAAGALGCEDGRTGVALLDPDVPDVATEAGELADGGDGAESPWTRASCVHEEGTATTGCSTFADLDGQGQGSMQYARALCESNGGAWREGDCPPDGATGRCEQPGKPPSFAQTDWCYRDADVCRSTCAGTFTPA